MPAVIPAPLREERLKPPAGRVRFVLDTDTKNEIDDQFAVVYALTSPKLQCDALYAAPFKKASHPTAALGMEASYEEILRLIELMGYENPPPVLRGSERFITEGGAPPESDAVRDLIERCQGPEPVYVVAIGALTNIAAALLLRPEIAQNMILLWLGGHPEYWHTAREFNLSGDIKATQIVLDSGVPLVRFPCKNVAEHVVSVPAEIEAYVGRLGRIGAYLSRIFADYIPGELRSKVIWDVVPLAWLVSPEWVPSRLVPTPRLRDDETWDLSDTTRPLCRVAIDARRDPILKDFVASLSAYVERRGAANESA